MDKSLVFEYDRIGDIMHVTQVAPYSNQGTIEIEEDVLARINPETGDVEGLEILFWSKRLAAGEQLVLPIEGTLRLSVEV
jgi:uncharacterized protein YuzE